MEAFRSLMIGAAAVAPLGKAAFQDAPERHAESEVRCYPSYDKQWRWPVQLDAERQSQLPPYSTRNYFLEQLAKIRPSHRFEPDRTNFLQWQRELRQELKTRLGFDTQVPSPLESQRLSIKQFTGYRLEEILFQSEPDVWVPSILYLPDHVKGPTRTLINCHGHGIGVDDPLYAYVLEFVKRGYVVLAPQVRDFGDRAFGKPQEMSCDRTYKLAAMLGKCLVGLRLWDFIRAVDYLETRPEVDRNRIACGGLSLGGELAMLLAALDDRLKAAFVSGFLSTYDGLMFRVNNCTCYAILGILTLCHMPDIAGLIAPRPLVIQSGTRDAPVPTEYAQQAFREVKAIYQAAEAGEKAILDVFDGVHEFHGDAMFTAFEHWL